MKNLFRREPLREYPDYSSSHLQAGKAYRDRFHKRPGRAAMWELEKPLLENVFRSLAPRRALDFATGTGRIVSVLEGCLPDCEIHGTDISEDMLKMARAQCKQVVFHTIDGRQALEEFGKEAFDMVSAFRFFPNADQRLREDAADQITGLIRPGGYAVFNNHRNFWSISYLAMRAVGNSDGNYGSPNSDIKQLFLQRGFSCVRGYSLGVWPQTDLRSFGLSWSATSALERFNGRYLSMAHCLGYNTIFIFRKTR